MVWVQKLLELAAEGRRDMLRTPEQKRRRPKDGVDPRSLAERSVEV